MLYSQRMPLKTRQFDVTFLFISVDGTAATPVASGPDAKFVKTVTDLGAGNYKIDLKDKAQRNLHTVGHEVFTDGLYMRVTAVDQSSVTVLIKTFAGVATDGSFNICLAYHDNKTLY